MFIAHAPAAYLVTRLLLSRLGYTGTRATSLLLAGILGALAPDLDLLYFYAIDHRQHHHHSYFTHFPVLWVGLCVATTIWVHQASRYLRVLALVFSINGFVHMCLDSIVGDIRWFAPFSETPFSLFSVPALYTPWWLNFLLHWSFALELLVLAWAICQLLSRRSEAERAPFDGAQDRL
ncbi:MAG: metal-dependent hydrolase [Nevskiales bacterium]